MTVKLCSCCVRRCVCCQLQLLHHKEEHPQEPGQGTPGAEWQSSGQLSSTLVNVVPTVNVVNIATNRDSCARAKVCEDCLQCLCLFSEPSSEYSNQFGRECLDPVSVSKCQTARVWLDIRIIMWPRCRVVRLLLLSIFNQSTKAENN